MESLINQYKTMKAELESARQKDLYVCDEDKLKQLRENGGEYYMNNYKAYMRNIYEDYERNLKEREQQIKRKERIDAEFKELMK